MSLSGSILAAYLPDSKNEALMKGFRELHKKIDQVSDDIKHLENTVEWESTELSYAECVSRIEQATQYLSKMTEASNENDSSKFSFFQKEVVKVELTGELSRALYLLLDGIIGKGAFGNKPILSRFYTKTAGHRKKVSELSGRLFQLVVGGCLALMASQVHSSGDKNAAEYVREMYADMLKIVPNVIEDILNRCLREARTNIESDFFRIFGESGGISNHDAANNLLDALMETYDWKMFVCLVYNKLTGFENHCIMGYYVHVFCQSGKCAVAFYDKRKPFKNVHHIQRVKAIIQHAFNYHVGAKGVAESIKRDLDSANLPWLGIACIKRWVDLWKSSCVGNRVVWVLVAHCTVFVILE